MKKYTLEEVLNKFNKKGKDKQITILWDALDYMSKYNGRTKLECVALAMGLELYEL